MARAEDAVIPVPGGEVRARLQGPPDPAPLLLLAPGAGAPMEHPFMESVAAGLADRGIRVGRFNFLYSTRGKKAPDRQPVLEQTYRAVAEHLRASEDPARFYVGGKSMGGRIASHIVSGPDALDADGAVFLGYPLHPPGKPERLRDAHLYDVKVPMLFVEGTRDPFCPLGTLEQVLRGIPAATEVAAIEGGDHSFKVPGSSARSSGDALGEVVEAVASWIVRTGPRDGARGSPPP